MFVWIVRLCIFAFMVFTMAAVGTECYIAPHYWAIAVLWYWYAMRPTKNNLAS